MFRGDPPPAELVLAWQCERWQTLPEAGGLYDQEHKIIQRMSSLLNVYRAVETWRNATGEKIHLLSDGTRRILRALQDMGINFNV